MSDYTVLMQPCLKICQHVYLRLSAACLKEKWAGKKADTAAIAEDKKKKKSKKKKSKNGDDSPKKEKKVKKKKKKSKISESEKNKRKTEEAGYSSDEEIQKKVPLGQDKTELWQVRTFLFVLMTLMYLEF